VRWLGKASRLQGFFVVFIGLIFGFARTLITGIAVFVVSLCGGRSEAEDLVVEW
jgi:hypothetical protein